jgi:hypothetical protein
METNTAPIRGVTPADGNDIPTQLGSQCIRNSIGVSFNGTAAAFKVKSDTYLKVTVPDGATTGPVTVTTPGGMLTSNRAFRVRPQIFSFSPSSGPVGTPVTITGDSLTQTTRVGFDWLKAASFTVNSDTQVTAVVPTGAMTGRIQIRTKGGLAKPLCVGSIPTRASICLRYTSTT